jgi:hypothetical protein
MSRNDDLEEVLEALARAEGRDVEDLKADLIRDRLATHGVKGADGPSRAPARPLARTGARALAREERVEFPGSPVVRSERDFEETPAEAQDRWYQEEQELADGVHGWGGQSAGGIFGDGAIATEEYDPMAEQRAERRTATHASAQQAVAVTELTQAVGTLMDRLGLNDPNAGRNILPGMGRRLLGRGRRRR